MVGTPVCADRIEARPQTMATKMSLPTSPAIILAPKMSSRAGGFPRNAPLQKGNRHHSRPSQPDARLGLRHYWTKPPLLRAAAPPDLMHHLAHLQHQM